jgi:hypothetical protein
MYSAQNGMCENPISVDDLEKFTRECQGRCEMSRQRCQENWEGDLFYWPGERVEQGEK